MQDDGKGALRANHGAREGPMWLDTMTAKFPLAKLGRDAATLP